MQYRYKRTTLIQILRVIERIEKENLDFKYPLVIKRMQNNICLKVQCTQGCLTFCFHKDHPTSEISMIYNGMRYIYSRRDLRLKRHTLEDLIQTISRDNRLCKFKKPVELIFVEIVRLDEKEIIDSVYLG